MMFGDTPAFVAAQYGHVASLRALAELGADLNRFNGDGNTPAFVAAQQGQEASLRVLGELGADLNIPDVHIHM